MCVPCVCVGVYLRVDQVVLMRYCCVLFIVSLMTHPSVILNGDVVVADSGSGRVDQAVHKHPTHDSDVVVHTVSHRSHGSLIMSANMHCYAHIVPIARPRVMTRPAQQ
jgi:hypothetical protein